MKVFLLGMVLIAACGPGEIKNDPRDEAVDTVIITNNITDTSHPVPRVLLPGPHPDSLLAFARTLQGIPYLYASTDPAKGFDCSGFITYVFNHFGVSVPRSSVDFTNYGRELDPGLARPGDLVLFTGTDSTIRIVGHMGIIESIRNGTIHFIHSTSGKNRLGVVITPLEKYYRSRFVKTIRVFPDHYFE
jgi:cell wall-associated NlpC family hydrolase